MKNNTQYQIGNKYFSSKQAIAKCAQEILKQSTPGKVINGGDKDFIMGLIYCHPRSKDKIGTGIKHIIARVDPVWKKGKQFLIIRVDGSVIDFSYKKCIFGEISAIDIFRTACRTAIVDDIINFKVEHLTSSSTCPYFGTQLTRDNAHVDHVKPMTFNVLVDLFIKKNKLNIEGIEVIGLTQKQFSDHSLSNLFLEFHRKKAVLELVSDRANQTCCKVNFKEKSR